MSTVSKRKMTPEEYLAKERAAEFRSEFFNGEMFAMAGASWAHTLIKDNLSHEIRNALGASPCLVVTSDLRVKIDATGLYTYSDVIVVCDEPKFEDGCNDTLVNPQVIVEVLSDSTEKYDRGTKFKHYRSVPSIKEYILIAQDESMIERFAFDGEIWSLTDFSGLAVEFAFATLPVRISLDRIYRGVEFPPLQPLHKPRLASDERMRPNEQGALPEIVSD